MKCCFKEVFNSSPQSSCSSSSNHSQHRTLSYFAIAKIPHKTVLQIVKAPSFSPGKYQLSAYQWLLCWPDGGGSSSLDDVNYTQTPKQLMSKLALKTPEWAAKHMVATVLQNRILCVLNNRQAPPKGPKMSSHRGRVPVPGSLMLVKDKAHGYVVEMPTAPTQGSLHAENTRCLPHTQPVVSFKPKTRAWRKCPR